MAEEGIEGKLAVSKHGDSDILESSERGSDHIGQLSNPDNGPESQIRDDNGRDSKIYLSKKINERKKGCDKDKAGRQTNRRQGLEGIISTVANEAKDLGVDPTEYMSSEFARNLIRHSKEAEDRSSDEDYNAEQSLWRGAVAIIYNLKTRQVKMEEKPPNYPLSEFIGLPALIGGSMESFDYRSERTIVRELGEEVKDKLAKEILISNFNSSGRYLGVTTDLIFGNLVKTDVYELHVPSIEDWITVAKSPLTHDAGTSRVFTFDEILSKNDDEFAFHHGAFLKDFIRNILHYEVLSTRFTNGYNLNNDLFAAPSLIQRPFIAADFNFRNIC